MSRTLCATFCNSLQKARELSAVEKNNRREAYKIFINFILAQHTKSHTQEKRVPIRLRLAGRCVGEP